MSNNYSPTEAALAAVPAADITDKRGYAARWGFSVRKIDNLLAEGLPHLAIGKRRIRICVSEADAWMRVQFRVQRRGAPKRQVAGPPAQLAEGEGVA